MPVDVFQPILNVAGTIATVAAVFVTAVYVWLTYGMLKSTRDATMATQRHAESDFWPIVVGRVRNPDPQHLEIELANAGTGPAFGLNVEITSDQTTFDRVAVNGSLPIAILLQGETTSDFDMKIEFHLSDAGTVPAGNGTLVLTYHAFDGSVIVTRQSLATERSLSGTLTVSTQSISHTPPNPSLRDWV